jgi:Response regulator containing CheY-like receiver, AAA-type ATPase, and DNA-binding domains
MLSRNYKAVPTLSPTVEFLVVDDDPRVGRFVAAFLENKKHTSVTFTGAADTIAWLQNNHCEVAILDVDMPKVDGIALIPLIRDVDPHLPIIMFTGWGYDEEQMHASLRAGANAFVSKNLQGGQLYGVLERVLGTARQKSQRNTGPAIAVSSA